MARIPAYRRQRGKSGDRAFVEFGGVRVYLGAYNSPESRELYGRKLAEWEAGGGRLPAPCDDLTVTELSARYWTHAGGFYVKNGEPTGEQGWIRDSLKALCKLYGSSAAGEFGPLALKCVRSKMIEAGLARTTINSRVSKIKRMFAWATENELVSPIVYQGLRAVAGLKVNRSDAKEPEPVVPVPVADVEAILPLVPPAVAVMLRLQLLTGMRPGEVRIMRMCDLDMTVDPWEYVPSRHKSEHHNQRRVIMFGTRCQEILQPYLIADAKRFLFRPLKPKGGHIAHPNYDKSAYALSIARACKRASVPRFGPNRLRHNAATAFRSEFGLESTQSALGHSRAETSEIYAQTSLDRAREIARRVG